MRQITRYKGRHLGVHYIFDGYSEAVKYLSGELAHLNVLGQDLTRLDCFPHWMLGDVREGEWVTTDNGIVIQVLKIHRMKEDRRPYEIVGVKTVGLYAFYMNYVQGEKKGYRMSRGNMNVTDESITDNRAKQTMGASGIARNTKKIWKRLFVYYLVVYMSPVFAFQLMNQKRCAVTRFKPGYVYYYREAYELLKDPFVIRELESYMSVETFRDRLTKHLGRQGINEERIARELAEGLDNVRKGTLVHKQFIELTMNLMRYAVEKENIGADGRAVAAIERAEPANFVELPMPPKALDNLVNEETKLLVKINKEENETNVDHTGEITAGHDDTGRETGEDEQQCSAEDGQNPVDIGIGSSSLPEVI